MKKLLTVLGLLFFATVAQADKRKDLPYGDNMITVNPFVGYATPQLSDVGIGLGYERFLNDYISAKLPINMGLTTGMMQTGLGLKFYPTGHKRAVKYAVGPTLIYTRSSDGYTVQQFDSVNNFWFEQKVENPLTQFGFLLNNSLNVTIQEHVYLGAEMGLGLNYLNSYRDDPIQSGFFRQEEPNVLFLFTLNLGYRF